MKYTLLLALTTVISLNARVPMTELPPAGTYERDVVIWGRAVADELHEMCRQDHIIMAENARKDEIELRRTAK